MEGRGTSSHRWLGVRWLGEGSLDGWADGARTGWAGRAGRRSRVYVVWGTAGASVDARQVARGPRAAHGTTRCDRLGGLCLSHSYRDSQRRSRLPAPIFTENIIPNFPDSSDGPHPTRARSTRTPSAPTSRPH